MAFGESAALYDSARKQYPEQIIDKITQIIDNECDSILDLGCGTGIATRQLAQILNKAIIACDIDSEMIETAKQMQNSKINYHVMPTNNLALPDNYVKTITAFGGFHWFCDTKSVNEIQRVLKPNGVFFIINKDNDTFKHEIYSIISKYCDLNHIKRKINYNPKLILSTAGFTNIDSYSCNCEELYINVEELLNFIQTLKFWEYVDNNRKPQLLDVLRINLGAKFINNQSYCKNTLTNLVWGYNYK